MTKLTYNPFWSIDGMGNAIAEKFIPSLKVKYEISSSIEFSKPQIGELARQHPPRAVAFHPDFFLL